VLISQYERLQYCSVCVSGAGRKDLSPDMFSGLVRRDTCCLGLFHRTAMAWFGIRGFLVMVSW